MRLCMPCLGSKEDGECGSRLAAHGYHGEADLLTETWLIRQERQENDAFLHFIIIIMVVFL